MPYFDPFDEDSQWLPRRRPPIDTPIGPMASAAPPGFATPPFMPSPAAPPTLPPPAPMDAIPAPSALDTLASHAANQPLRSDPRYAPSTTRRILGGLAGAGLGAAEGFVNASGRTRIQGGGGAALADGIVNAKFNKANRDFNEQGQVLKTQADIEMARANDQRKAVESEARVKSESAQEAAANAARDRANRIEAPKPIEVGGKLVTPDGKVVYEGAPPKEAPVPQTIDQYINQIRLDPTLTPEVKEERIKQRLSDHNAAHPQKPISPTAAGLAVAAAKGDAEAAKALKVLGTYNDKPKAAASSNGGGGQASDADTKTADAIIHGTMTISQLPQGDRRRIGTLVDARRNEIAPKLTPKQKDAQDKMTAIDRMIDDLEVEYTTKGDIEGVGRAAGSGIGQYIDESFGKDNTSIDNRATLGNIGAELIHEKYGSALSKGENERARTFIPGPSDPPNVVITKLRKLKAFHKAKRDEWNKAGGAPSGGGNAKPPVTSGGKVAVGQRRKNLKTGQIELITAIDGDNVTSVPDPD